MLSNEAHLKIDFWPYMFPSKVLKIYLGNLVLVSFGKKLELNRNIFSLVANPHHSVDNDTYQIIFWAIDRSTTSPFIHWSKSFLESREERKIEKKDKLHGISLTIFPI